MPLATACHRQVIVSSLVFCCCALLAGTHAPTPLAVFIATVQRESPARSILRANQPGMLLLSPAASTTPSTRNDRHTPTPNKEGGDPTTGETAIKTKRAPVVPVVGSSPSQHCERPSKTPTQLPRKKTKTPSKKKSKIKNMGVEKLQQYINLINPYSEVADTER